MSSSPLIQTLASPHPSAIANIRGDMASPVKGLATFYNNYMGGVLVQVEVFHLPDNDRPYFSGFFGMHIHEFGDCTPPFDKTGNHYNPTYQDHPFHAGDFPPLLSGHGYAWMSFWAPRISISEIIGKSIIIHKGKDDFTTQPSGQSGEKIACGVIEAYI